MPYLYVRVSVPESRGAAERIAAALMKRTSEVLGKKPELTSIAIEFASAEHWFVGGTRAGEQGAVTFYLDVKITDGTNTKSQKADYVKSVFADFESMFGPILPASYIVIDDVRADSWGYQGRTQEHRFIRAQAL